MNGAIHSLIILGILAFGRGYGSSFKKEERRKKMYDAVSSAFLKGLLESML